MYNNLIAHRACGVFMKKRYAIVLIVCLAILLVAALSACDPDPNSPFSPEAPTSSSYTVTFDTNGALYEYPEDLAPITGVKYGATISEPLHNGNKIVLERTGYDFKGWTANSSDFVFGENGTKIVANTVIRAKFEAKKFYHIIDVASTVSYENGKYVVDPYGHATRDAGGDVVMSADDYLSNSLGEEVNEGGERTKLPETNISFAEGAIGPDTTLYSTYAATSPSRVAIPSRMTVDGEEEDKFCFWFYLTDTLDEDGNRVMDGDVPLKHPVQFSEWAKDGATDVAVRSVTYTQTAPLHLYAMFESDLPSVTVEYYESETSTSALKTDSYPLNKNILESQKFDPLTSEALEEHAEGYDFSHWYFVYYTENEDEDGDPIRNVQKFIFDNLNDSGASTVDDATSPLDAAHNDISDETPSGELNFRPATLKLYASWVKLISIATKDDYLALCDAIAAGKAALAKSEPTAEETAAIDAFNEILSATIMISGDIDFAGETLSPLFDEANPFTGTIDGGVYTQGDDGEKVISGKRTISGATVVGETHSSLFGYVNGVIKNLDLQNCEYTVTAIDKVCYLGAFASCDGGSFSRCSATGISFELPSGAGFAYIGGLAGRFSDVANAQNKGEANECSAQVSIATKLSAKGLCIGGLFGESGASTTISNCSATITLADVEATAPQGALSSLRIGGIAGDSAASLSASEATLTISVLNAKGSALIGGLLGQNAGNISRCASALNMTPSAEGAITLGSSAPMQVVAAGGLVGLNEGYMINSYATVNVTLNATSDQTVYVGGLVGDNSSARGDSESDQEKGTGAINRCYSQGTVSVTVSQGSPNLYVGGMVGFSKHSKFARNFSLTNISISYEKTDLIHAGFIYGSLDKSAVFSSGYYASENTIIVNDKTYLGSDYLPKENEGEGENEGEQQPETSSDAIYSLGTPRPKADFADKDVVFGTNSDEKDLGWKGGSETSSENIWELKEGAEAPTLIGIGNSSEQ